MSEEHRNYAISRLSEALRRKWATKGDLASIAGVLTWISFVFTPGLPRRQLIYYAARLGSSHDKSARVAIEGPLQRQMSWWRSALRASTFTGSRVWSRSESPVIIPFRSDASGEDGWGACIEGYHIVGPWPAALQDAHMLFKELLPVVLCLTLWSAAKPESVFGVVIDNTGAMFSVNKMTCRDDISRRLLQQLASALDAGGHTAIASHVRRHRNQHTDDLSHALPGSWWRQIVQSQCTTDNAKHRHDWLFPFVIQDLRSGECRSGVFRMRRSLFGSGNFTTPEESSGSTGIAH